MNLPSHLLNEIKRGQVVLFLGSGATIGSSHPKNHWPPVGPKLAELLAAEFLGGKMADQPLAMVSELSIANSDQITVQAFIRDLFKDFSPADFHLKLPTFRWRAIFTTNYDLVIEEAYKNQPKRNQSLVPFISDADRIDDLVTSRDDLPYIKLHGCISRAQVLDPPLILTVDQYNDHRNGRSRLFDVLKDIGHERSIVFIGYSLQDANLRAILKELDKSGGTRPSYYLIKPNVSDLETRLWEQKRISPLKGTLEEFVSAIELGIPEKIRGLLSEADYSHPIETNFVVHEKMGEICINFFKNDADYVHVDMPIQEGSPEAFYKGFELGWYPIARGLDVKRGLIDTILADVILPGVDESSTGVEFYAIKAEAGAGKTIFLRHLAWEASKEWKALCIFIRHYGKVNLNALQEIYRLTQKRLFIFIDEAADRATEIEKLIVEARKKKLPITVITAERINEWNMGCEYIDSFITEHYELNYLNKKEIIRLIELLTSHGSLGHLSELNPEQQLEEFEKRAGRQLLVALHEATEGLRFEEILEDEFHSIQPDRARAIYLAICTLHRFGSEVRAGIIYRRFGVAFTEFQEKFFKPLEKVVQVGDHPFLNYPFYTARHPQIAEVIFNRVLKHPEDRFAQVSALLNTLNISYDSDKHAYRQLVKARSLLSMFPDHQDVVKIFEIAELVAPKDAYRLQQNGIYEMNRPNSNLDTAYSYFTQSEALNENNPTITHSFAELARIRAKRSNSLVEKIRFRKECRELIRTLPLSGRNQSYGKHTLIKLGLDELREAIANEDFSGEEVERLTRSLERSLDKSTQQFPNESKFLEAESEFREILDEEAKALDALRKAFSTNPRSASIAIRLSKSYQASGDIDEAVRILQGALESNRGERRLHYHLAHTLKQSDQPNLDTLIYHFKRGYSPSDTNYLAQFWHGRYLYEKGDLESTKLSKNIFKTLIDNISAPYDFRTSIRDKITEQAQPKIFNGQFLDKFETHGFIARADLPIDIYTHCSENDEAIWESLQKNTRVQFEIGFNFHGPAAINITVQ